MKLACVLSLVCLLSLPTINLAQTRPRTSRRRTSTARTRANTNSTTVNEARLRVADRIKLLTKFLYLFARTSKDIEATEAAARGGGSNNLPPQAAAILDRNKAALLSNLGNVREGLDALELYFRTTPEVQRYYGSLSGVAAGAADAESKASAGQFDAAGRTLLDVVNRLADVLLEME